MWSDDEMADTFEEQGGENVVRMELSNLVLDDDVLFCFRRNSPWMLPR